MRQAHWQDFFQAVGIDLAQQAYGFGSFRGRRRLQHLHEILRGFGAQASHDLDQQVAVLAETAVPETIGHIMDRRQRHQIQNIGHAVCDVPAAQRFLDKFRQTLFRADAWSQALRRSGSLRLDAVQ